MRNATPCLTCGTPTRNGARCPKHTATRQQRGYDDDWLRLSREVIAAAGGRCQLQLSVCTGVATTADHIIPKDHGGTDDRRNLQAACRPCNGSKGAS